MRRREFITLLGGSTAVVWPCAARAQQPPTMPVIGWLSSGSRVSDDISRLPPFRLGLNEMGYIEGRNIAIEYRRADDQIERLPALAADLAGRQVSLILAAGRPDAALAAKSATTSIPIVFNNAADPVQLGLVASLSRPGGNVTGITTASAELEAKRLGLLRELVPSATSIAVLVNPSRPGVNEQLVQAQQAAQAEPLVNTNRVKINILINAERLPTIHGEKGYVEAGGLMSYGANYSELFRRAAEQVDKILRGAKPGDIPVEQPTKFDLAINLTTAKALGITPRSQHIAGRQV